MKWAGHVARMGEGRRGMCMGFRWDSQKKRPHGRPRRIWDDGIRIYLK
jgi:hypothetical protein